MTKYSTQIASNLRQIEELNMQVRAILPALSNGTATDHQKVVAECNTMRINNLMFWVKHWTSVEA